MPYLPGLDGLRAIAVLVVIAYHTNRGWLPGGYLGVEVFFVVSGYLITLLLIGEHERSGSVDLGQFWLRRARRLLPAVFTMLALLVVYCALFRRNELAAMRGDVVAGLAYVSNWYQIAAGQGYTDDFVFAPLRHLWSLGVEEQFYLLWPLVMVVLMRKGRSRLFDLSRWLVVVALGITVATALLFRPGRTVSPNTTPDQYWTLFGHAVSRTSVLYESTLTRSTGLLLGAAFAMIWRPVAVMRGPLKKKPWLVDLWAVLGLAALAIFCRQVALRTIDGPDPLLFRGGLFAVGLATVFVIAACTHPASLVARGLGVAPLRWVGTRSYGLYLFHWPIFQIVRGTAGEPLLGAELPVALLLTAAVAELSYRLVETPVRAQLVGPWIARLRRARDPGGRRVVGTAAVASVALVSFAGVSLATAQARRSAVPTGNVSPIDIGELIDSGEMFTEPTVDGWLARVWGPDAEQPDGRSGEPGSSAPGTTESAPTTLPGRRPGGAPGSGSSSRGSSSPVSSAPDTTDPDATGPDSSDSDTTEPESTDPDASDPDATGPDATDPQRSGADTTRPRRPVVDPDDEAPSTTSTPADPSSTMAAAPASTAPESSAPPTTIAASTLPATTSSTTSTSTSTTSTSTTSTSTTSTTTTSTTTTTTTTTSTTTIPPPPTTVIAPRMIAIGDSVMLGALDDLAAKNILVDAEVGRQIDDILPDVQALGAQRMVPDIVIVHLGTNGPLDEQTSTEFFDALESVPRVIVLNVHAERDWTEPNNELLAELADRYDNIELVDWNTLATECGGNCLTDDGIHLPGDGQKWYAQMVFDQINYGPDATPPRR